MDNDIQIHSPTFEGAAWLGLGSALLTFFICFGMTWEAQHVYGAITPSDISAWVTTICSAVLAIVNTGFVIYHRFHNKRRPRRHTAHDCEKST